MDRETYKKILEAEIKDCENALEDYNSEIDLLETIIDLENQTKLSVQDVFKVQRMMHVLKGVLVGEISGLSVEAANLIAKVVTNSDQTTLPSGVSFLSLLAVGTMAGYLNYRLNHKQKMTKKRDAEIKDLDRKIKVNQDFVDFYKQKKAKVAEMLQEKTLEKRAIERNTQAEVFER